MAIVPEVLWLPLFGIVLGLVLSLIAQRRLLALIAGDCPKLCSIKDAPWYLRGNPFITHGYRGDFTVKQSITSVLWFHNESANIWSHFLAALLFWGLTMAAIWELIADGVGKETEWVHQITVTIYCAGATCLFVLSTTFHWMGCVSEKVYKNLAKMDYSGIAIMILVSFFPFMYNCFYCSMGWGLFYSICISSLTVGALIVSWDARFSKPGYNWLRALLFIGMGLFGGIPLPHAVSYIGLEKGWPVVGPMLLMGGLYIGGAIIYVLHVPERWAPGLPWLNYVGHSHFIFHCCVVTAAVVHYLNIMGGGRVVCVMRFFSSQYGTKHIPKELRLRTAHRRLDVTFDGGETFCLPAEFLRVYSPSAEVFAHNGTWNVPPRRKGVSIQKMEPVGNYAVRLVFDDHHDTGIYPFDLLYDLGSNKFVRMRAYIRRLRQLNLSRRRLVSHKKT